jgi:hypothetical protein
MTVMALGEISGNNKGQLHYQVSDKGENYFSTEFIPIIAKKLSGFMYIII